MLGAAVVYVLAAVLDDILLAVTAGLVLSVAGLGTVLVRTLRRDGMGVLVQGSTAPSAVRARRPAAILLIRDERAIAGYRLDQAIGLQDPQCLDDGRRRKVVLLGQPDDGGQRRAGRQLPGPEGLDRIAHVPVSDPGAPAIGPEP